MLTPSQFTARLEALLGTARIAYTQDDLVRFVRRNWPEIVVENDAVAWAEAFAATLPRDHVRA